MPEGNWIANNWQLVPAGQCFCQCVWGRGDYFHAISQFYPGYDGQEADRKFEEKAVDAQENIRHAAKFRAKEKKTGQGSLFEQETLAEFSAKSYEEERNARASSAYQNLILLLKENSDGGIKYEKILGHILQTPLIWKSDLNKWLQELKKDGKIIIPEMKVKERVPKRGHTILWQGNNA